MLGLAQFGGDWYLARIKKNLDGRLPLCTIIFSEGAAEMQIVGVNAQVSPRRIKYAEVLGGSYFKIPFFVFLLKKIVKDVNRIVLWSLGLSSTY